MLGHNGVQLGIQRSATERKLFDALFRLSRVGLKNHAHPRITISRRKFHASARSRQQHEGRLTPEEKEAKRRAEANEEFKKKLDFYFQAGESKPKPEPDVRNKKLFAKKKWLEQMHDTAGGEHHASGQNGLLRQNSSNSGEDLETQLAQLAVRRRETVLRSKDGQGAKGTAFSASTSPPIETTEPEGNLSWREQSHVVQDDGVGTELGKAYRDGETADMEQLPPRRGHVGSKRKTHRHSFPKIEKDLWDDMRREESEELEAQKGGQNSITDIQQALDTLPKKMKWHPPKNLPEAQPEMSTQIRSIMRQIPSHVVALTTAYPDDKRSWGARSYRGMVMSSFNTVSLDPVPIVSFNIKMPSHTHDALKMSRQFFIHFLAANPIGESIAKDLSKPQDLQTTFKGGLSPDVSVSPFNVKYEKKDGSEGRVTLPLLLCDGLFGSVLRCSLYNNHDGHGYTIVNDHVLVRGIVKEVLDPVKLSARMSSFDHSQKLPLMYNAGVYRSLGDGPVNPTTSSASPQSPVVPRVANGVSQPKGHKQRRLERRRGAGGQSKGVGGWFRELLSR